MVEKFEFQGQAYSVIAVFSPGRADIILKGTHQHQPERRHGGRKHPAGDPDRQRQFLRFLAELQGRHTVRLAFYDFRRDRSRFLPLPGFSFIGLPEIIEEDNGLHALVFLGNRSDNDDIFYYEPENGLLTPLTATPFSEKGFTLPGKGRPAGNRDPLPLGAIPLLVSIPSRRECVLKEEKDRPARQKKIAAAATPDITTPISASATASPGGRSRACSASNCAT